MRKTKKPNKSSFNPKRLFAKADINPRLLFKKTDINPKNLFRAVAGLTILALSIMLIESVQGPAEKPAPKTREAVAKFIRPASGKPAKPTAIVKVLFVIDADSVKIKRDGKIESLRIAEIDAPEKKQSFGSASKKALTRMISGKDIKLSGLHRDQYGRLVAHVDASGLDVGKEMVRLGYAWAYRKYLKDYSLLAIEASARERRAGLWADKKPVAPWNFRHTKKVASGNRRYVRF